MSSENQPLIGKTMAFETKYEVSTHVLSSWPADSPPAICGSATLATLVSSTSMNVANVTTRAMIHGFTAGRHVESAGMAAAALIYFTITFGSTDIPKRK